MFGGYEQWRRRRVINGTDVVVMYRNKVAAKRKRRNTS